MGLSVEQVLSQLRVKICLHEDNGKFKFKFIVTWPLKRFEHTIHGETAFDSEDEAIAAAEIAKDFLLKAIVMRYLPEQKYG